MWIQKLRGLRSVMFLTQVSANEIDAHLRAADVSLVPLHPHPNFNVHVPSKPFDSKALCRPCVAKSEGVKILMVMRLRFWKLVTLALFVMGAAWFVLDYLDPLTPIADESLR
jgi:hypothetical protein